MSGTDISITSTADRTTIPDPAPIIANAARLRAVRRTMLLDSPPNEAFDRLTELACLLLDVPIALCSLLDERRYFFVSCSGLPEPYCTLRQVPAEAGFCKYTLSTRAPIVLRDASVDPLFSTFPVVAQMGIRGYVGVPLIASDGHALGTFCAMDRRPREWQPEQVRALETLAAAAITDIERAVALRAAQDAQLELQQRHRAAEALVESAAVLAGSRDVEQACQAIVANIRGLLCADAALLCVAEGDVLRAIAVDGDTGPRLRPGLAFPEGQGPPSLARRSRCVFITSDVLGDPDVPLTPELRDIIRAAPFRAVMSLPLMLNDVVIGTLCVMDRAGRVFTFEDRRLAEGFAHQAALALENARLLQDTERRRSEAEASNRAKDEFLSMLAHELRNPLAAIRGAVDLILRRADDTTVLEAAGVAQRQLAHQVRLLDDLLELARMTQGTIGLQRSRFSLGTIITDAVQTVRERVEQRRQVLSVDVPEQVAIEGDRTRLVQIVANLLANATKYTQEGGHIQLTGAVEDGFIVLRVRDDGIGIEPSVLPRVFDAFVQQDQSLARTAGGLGIGLTLVKRLVELHDGTVTASSNGPGRGSEFVVRLPLPSKASAQAPEPESPHEWTAPVTGGRRILIIEDNADARLMLAKVLSLAGHEVHEAEAGDDGIAAGLQLRPDVVLVDIGLPGTDGYEVARQLRAALGSSVLLCALTGYGRATDQRMGRAAGFDHYFVKPVDLQTLEQAVAASPAS